MTVYCMAVVSMFIVGRTVRDTLFLSRYPVSRLPYMYVAVAFCVAFASFGYSYYADRLRRDRVIIGSLAAGCGMLAGIWLLLVSNTSGDWVYPALYIIVEIVGGIAIIQFWTFANDIFSSREAKRLFGIIGFGGVISNVICGFAIAGVADVMGTENLLLICVLLLIVCVSCVRGTAREAHAEIESAMRKPKGASTGILHIAEGVTHIFRNKHLRLIAAMVAVTVLVTTIVDFQFKIIAKSAYEGQETGLATFFGYFFGFTGIIACVVQLFFTTWILERKGIIASLLILPLAMLIGVLGLVFLVPAISMLVAATLTKGSENVVRYTLYNSTMQLLYVPVPAHQRGRAKAFIDGILKPLGIGASGLVILLLRQWFVEEELALTLGWVDLILIAIWLALVFSIRGEYVRSLLNTLKARRLDFSTSVSLVNDETTAAVLRKALASKSETDVLHALELLPTTEVDVAEALARLLDHPSEIIRVTALNHMARAGRLDDLWGIQRRFHDDSEQVRAAAVQAFCALGGKRAVRTARPFLDDSSPVVRAAVVTGLIKFGGLDGILAAADTLKCLIGSDDPRERIQGANVLADIGVGNFYEPVLELMQDDAQPVRVAAIRAAGSMGSMELVPSLIYKLAPNDTARAATEALIAFGPRLEGLLLKVLDNDLEDRKIRIRIPKILAKIGGPESFRRLVASIPNAGPELGAMMARAAARLRERIRAFEVDDRPLVEATRNALREAYQELAIIEDLQLEPEDLLTEAISMHHKKHIGLAFRLLEIRYPSRTIQLVYTNLASENKRLRANAIEVLDNIVASDEARVLLPLLDDHNNHITVKKGAEMFELKRLEPQAWIGKLLDDADPWLVACTLDLIGRKRFGQHLNRVAEHASSDDQVIRETACHCLSHLVGNGTKASATMASELDRVASEAADHRSKAVQRAGASLRAALAG